MITIEERLQMMAQDSNPANRQNAAQILKAWREAQARTTVPIDDDHPDFSHLD